MRHVRSSLGWGFNLGPALSSDVCYSISCATFFLIFTGNCMYLFKFDNIDFEFSLTIISPIMMDLDITGIVGETF